jgi:DNA-binding LacI/PurR family transcriptional regulator
MRVTLEEIAKKAGVARMTVSRALSGKSYISKETEKKIKKIADEMGYQPNLIARSLSIRKSMTIGIFMPKTKNIFLDVYITQILSGITDIVQEFDYRIMFFPYPENGRKKGLYTSIANSKLIDGMVLLKTKMDDPDLESLASSGFPFVCVNYRKKDDKYNFVDSKNKEGARLAVEHLVSLGHKRIGFVAGSPKETNAVDRFAGYKQVMSKYKLETKPEWIIDGDFSKEKAYENTEKLFSGKSMPTAIVSSDDYMAIGVMEKLKEHGLSVPGDISIVGFDDIELASYIHPQLTTVRQPIYEIGKSSAEMLLNLINKTKNVPHTKYLDVELIVRGSTSSPAKHK